MLNNKYYLGLDIGTDSVGYAVTDEDYNLLKHKGESEWGVHLFEAAMLNDERRKFRAARRRLDRRQQRVKLLQEIFAEEIAKKDELFYRRLKESAVWREEATEPYTLFADKDYTDIDYHKQYPTIHHLICELIHNQSPHDVRLVYLACAWLVAHRGHFLNEVSKENISEIISIDKVYEDFINFFDEEKPWICDVNDFAQILKQRIGINAKYKKLCMLLFGNTKAPREIPNDTTIYYNKEGMLKLLCGGKFSAKELFANEEYGELPSFSLDKSDEELAPILLGIGDDAELVLRLKALYDWAILEGVLSGTEYISETKVATYKQHKNDLYILKKIVRKYLSKTTYKEIFRSESKSNYVGYVKKAEKSVSQEEFCKFIKGVLKNTIVDAGDKADFDLLMQRVEDNTLCPKQVNSENRVIPYQVYWVELNAILDNASKYLPFLNTSDSDGYIAKEKILSIFEFKIPYFVGPLNRASLQFAWFERKAEGKIVPWNFESLVDFENSEKAFIDRMTNTCTYLPFANVLPKCALLHEKFQVLNEINTINVNSVRIPVNVKQQLYNDLFMSGKKITKKDIKNYFLKNGYYSETELQSLSGIDDVVKSSLYAHKAFKNFLISGCLSNEEVEDIIESGTYIEGKWRFSQWLDKHYSKLSNEDRRYISNLKFKNFASISRELLCDIFGTETISGTGEASAIIERMWSENVTLMEMLSDRYTYNNQIRQEQENYYLEHPKNIQERMDEMHISNAVRRPIIRTLNIVSDVVKVNGSAPEKIFIEMARGGKPEDKGKRTKSRYQQLKELYGKCSLEDVRELSNRLDAMGDDRDNRLQGEKLFLYYLQLGKSMYSGKTIDIENLSNGKLYDVDHIYPQCKVKDDSLLNNKVLVLSEENAEKGDLYPIKDEIRRDMGGWWKKLLDNGFITEEKYKRLVRHTPFDENEQWGFINRQLVETRQSTKAVAALLKERYPNTEIVYVKAGLVSEFRQEFDMLKSRAVNDLHHAKDAYLNIVVGNVYNEKFTRKWFFEHRDDYNLKVKTLFSHEVKLYNQKIVWQGQKALAKIKSTVNNKNAIHLTRYAFCRKGGFFDMQPVKAAPGLIPLKKGLPTDKYGGYKKATASFFVLAKYRIGEKTEIIVMPVELLFAKEFLNDNNFAEKYAKETVEKIIGKKIDNISFPIGMRQIKINTLLELDGMPACVCGKSSGGKSVILSLNAPLIVGYKWEKYIKHIERFVKKKKDHPNMIYSEKYDKISSELNIELYDLLTAKLSSKMYSKRPANPIDILRVGREKFVAADVFEQSKCLLQIIAVFSRISGGCDLQTIGGAGKAASTVNFSSSLINWKKNFEDVRIVDRTASGLFEKRTGNLLELL